MTESEWLASANSRAMLAWLEGRAHGRVRDRKLRLLAVAASRLAWEFIHPAGHAVLEVAERVADGRAGLDELVASYEEETDAGWVGDSFRWSGDVINWACGLSARSFHSSLEVANLVREVFGNPFRPEQVEELWCLHADGAARRLAEEIYEGRDFAQMPYLGDALEDGGCPSAAILEHCRLAPGHVRGCWVLDLVLGEPPGARSHRPGLY